MTDDKITVENINTPGRSERVNAAKYQAMREALWQVLPTGEPGLTHAQMIEQVQPLLPEALFPAGRTAGWWSKTVQLDLEAKQLLQRHATTPLTWSRTHE